MGVVDSYCKNCQYASRNTCDYILITGEARVRRWQRMYEKENRKAEEGESMKNAPCLNCERRAVGCHSTCEDYLEFRKKHEQVAAARLDEINIESIGYKSEGRYKTTLRRQKKKWKKRH